MTSRPSWFLLVTSLVVQQSPRMRGFGGKGRPTIPRLRFFFFFFFWSGDQLAHTNSMDSLSQDQCLGVQRAEMTVDEHSLTSCVWARFPSMSPTLCLDSIVRPIRFRWVKGACLFSCNLPLHLWQNSRGLIRDTAVIQEWNGHWIRVGTES